MPQKWNSHFFEASTLTSVGLIIQLKHHIGNTCLSPSSLHNLMVFDLSGIHHLIVHYCCCDRPTPNYIQLLCVHWFPAMTEHPSTVFAFNILDFFHKLQNQSKCNPYNFYHTIIQCMDTTGLNPKIVWHFLCTSHFSYSLIPQHCYNKITLVLCLWSHLQLLKWGGAVHYSPTAESLPDGSMAIACPACPQPGKNTAAFSESESYE